MAGDPYFDKIRDRWNASGVGTTAGVTVTKSAATGFKYVVTGIQTSGDAACLVTIESPASTVLWKKRFAGAFNNGDASFAPGTLVGAADSDVLVKISASTAACEANIQGYKVKA